MEKISRLFTASEIKSGTQIRMIASLDVNSFIYISRIRIKVLGTESSLYFDSSTNPQLKIHHGVDSDKLTVYNYSLPCEVGNIYFDKLINTDKEIQIDNYSREQIMGYDENNEPIIVPAFRNSKKGLDVNITPSPGITGTGVSIRVIIYYERL